MVGPFRMHKTIFTKKVRILIILSNSRAKSQKASVKDKIFIFHWIRVKKFKLEAWGNKYRKRVKWVTLNKKSRKLLKTKVKIWALKSLYKLSSKALIRRQKVVRKIRRIRKVKRRQSLVIYLLKIRRIRQTYIICHRENIRSWGHMWKFQSIQNLRKITVQVSTTIPKIHKVLLCHSRRNTKFETIAISSNLVSQYKFDSKFHTVKP